MTFVLRLLEIRDNEPRTSHVTNQLSVEKRTPLKLYLFTQMSHNVLTFFYIMHTNIPKLFIVGHGSQSRLEGHHLKPY